MCNLRSSTSTTTTTRIPETMPIIAEPSASTASHPAVTPTRPASEPFKHIETSGLPFLNHVYSIVVQVATAGAIVVVTKMDARELPSQAAAPLKPYHPNQRMKQPRAPSVIEWPGIAFTFLTLPALSFTYLPSRGPTIIAPISAVIPPTE